MLRYDYVASIMWQLRDESGALGLVYIRDMPWHVCGVMWTG